MPRHRPVGVLGDVGVQVGHGVDGGIPGQRMVGEPAVLGASDGQPGLVDPGGQALHRAAEMPDGPLSDHPLKFGARAT
jgi:hypothetical protein